MAVKATFAPAYKAALAKATIKPAYKYPFPTLFSPSVVIVSPTSIRPRVSINWP